MKDVLAFVGVAIVLVTVILQAEEDSNTGKFLIAFFTCLFGICLMLIALWAF